MSTDVQTVPMVVRADWVPGPPQGCWTYDAYAAIPDDGHRYEIVDGVLYMAAAPNLDHQASILRFATHFWTHVEVAGLGRVFVAPTDVELAPGQPVVQPDVIVVLTANLGILTESRIIGVPDLVVEILSPGTAGYDRRIKQDAYARAGVHEYWLADPYARSIEILQLEGSTYRSAGVFSSASLLPSQVVPDLPVRVEEFFA